MPPRDLRKLTGPGTQLFTRARLTARETSYWTTRTSVGLIFGSGLLISIVVGIMVVYQIVSTQVSRQLPQFATLKAIGYADGALAVTVAAMSLMIAVAGFAPALAAALWLYRVIRAEDLAAGDDDGEPCRGGADGGARHGRGFGAAGGRRAAAGRPRRRVLSGAAGLAIAFLSLAGRAGWRPVPLAWRSLTANKRRLLRSSAGIGFAVLLMLMQLGFEKAFFDASLEVLRGLDGDIFLQSAHKYQFATQDPFPASDPGNAPRPCRGWRARGRSMPTGSICSGRTRSTASPTWSAAWLSTPTSRCFCSPRWTPSARG